MAHRLAEHGIELYYHTHHLEFQKYDGEYLLDIIKNNTTKLGFELDVHWIQRAGVNPVEFVKEYKGRISLLHLKDYRIGQMDLSEVDFKDMAKFMQIHDTIEFAELGEGNLDIKAIMEAGLEAVHNISSLNKMIPMVAIHSIVQISAENLRKLGYSDWF